MLGHDSEYVAMKDSEGLAHNVGRIATYHTTCPVVLDNIKDFVHLFRRKYIVVGVSKEEHVTWCTHRSAYVRQLFELAVNLTNASSSFGGLLEVLGVFEHIGKK